MSENNNFKSSSTNLVKKNFIKVSIIEINESFVQILNQINVILFKLIDECYQNKCIKFFEDYKTWSEAKNICESNNMTLISIHSKEENDFVWNLISKSDHLIVWIGGKRNSDHNRHEWINGEAFNYTNWLYDKAQREDYVSIRDICW